MSTNHTIDLTAIAWVLKRSGTHKYMDNGSWPDNRPCSGLKNLQKKNNKKNWWNMFINWNK